MWRHCACTQTHTHTHRRAHHTVALLLTHDQSKTHTHTDPNRIESTERSRSPTASSFYCLLNWNYTHTNSNWDFFCKRKNNYASKCRWSADKMLHFHVPHLILHRNTSLAHMAAALPLWWRPLMMQKYSYNVASKPCVQTKTMKILLDIWRAGCSLANLESAD